MPGDGKTPFSWHGWVKGTWKSYNGIEADNGHSLDLVDLSRDGSLDISVVGMRLNGGKACAMNLKKLDRWNRRRFMGASLAAAVVPVLNSPAAAALTAWPTATRDDIPREALAKGELARRIERTARRFREGKAPAFTSEFVLADVALSPPRRFNEYSGDLSGRYIEAVTLRPVSDSNTLDALVSKLLSFQREDGRFGDTSLVFTAGSIGPSHMALLWGNGRLLIGLLAYYRVSRCPEVLKAARRLGDFLLQIQEEAARPEVRQRLVGQGASGFICFTQLIEGLVMLKNATGDQQFLDRAGEIIPLLPPRGIQHAHGYLATLRGILDLANATGKPEHLASVEKKYADLLGSSDYTVFGSVLEYFGWGEIGSSDRDRKLLLAASGGDPRDEGCGHADFLRLSLGLWRTTGKAEYLEKAEHCLWNGFLLNQWSTGDFGSRVLSRTGLKPTDNVNRSWWCCTMHGYRAFPDLLQSIFTATGDALTVNLFADAQWIYPPLKLEMSMGRVTPTGDLQYRISIQEAEKRELGLSFRQPGWAGNARIRINDRILPAKQADRYWTIRRLWQAGDVVEILFPCAPRLLTRDNRILPIDQLGNQPLESALFYGPWLMGVDEKQDPLFFGEPWSDNLVYLPAKVHPAPILPGPAGEGPVRLRMDYRHGGFPGEEAVSLHPVYTTALEPRQSILAVWLKYQRR